MSGEERFFLRGTDPVKIEVVSPNGSVELLREVYGAQPIEPVIGDVAFKLTPSATLAFLDATCPNVICDERPQAKV